MTKPDNVLKMPAPTFESLPAKEKQKLITFGDGAPPYAGYVFDWGLVRWVPGEGVEDALAGVTFADPPRAVAMPTVAMAQPAHGGFVYLTQPHDMPIVAAYISRERAERDVEMIAKATGNRLQIIELPLES